MNLTSNDTRDVMIKKALLLITIIQLKLNLIQPVINNGNTCTFTYKKPLGRVIGEDLLT